MGHSPDFPVAHFAVTAVTAARTDYLLARSVEKDLHDAIGANSTIPLRARNRRVVESTPYAVAAVTASGSHRSYGVRGAQSDVVKPARRLARVLLFSSADHRDE